MKPHSKFWLTLGFCICISLLIYYEKIIPSLMIVGFIFIVLFIVFNAVNIWDLLIGNYVDFEDQGIERFLFIGFYIVTFNEWFDKIFE